MHNLQKLETELNDVAKSTLYLDERIDIINCWREKAKQVIREIFGQISIRKGFIKRLDDIAFTTKTAHIVADGDVEDIECSPELKEAQFQEGLVQCRQVIHNCMRLI